MRELCARGLWGSAVCERVVCVSSVEMVEERLCEKAMCERAVCERVVCEIGGMGGQRQLRQDHRERTWQFLVLAAKICKSIVAETAAVMKSDGPSQVSAAGKGSFFRTGVKATTSHVATGARAR